jgi:hypothetical protein
MAGLLFVSKPRCNRDHAQIKTDDAAWYALAFVGVQTIEPVDFDPAERLELRNCSCGSTLARRARDHAS